MKKVFLLILAILLVSGLILGGCAKPAPAPAPAPAPSPAPVEPIKLRFSHSTPPMAVFHKDIFVPWVEMVKERTTAIGKPVEITIFPAEALGKFDDQYRILINGTADIVGIWGPHLEPGRFHLALVTELPLLFSSATVAAQVAQELFDTWPELQDEYSDAKVLFFQPTAPAQINARIKQIKTLEDFKGLKAAPRPGIQTDVVKTMGAVPTMVPLPEVYISLERGMLDLELGPWEGLVPFRFMEVTKYRTALPQGLWINHLICSMNWDTWNSLPPEVQGVFEEVSGMYMSKFSGEAFDRADMQALDFVKDYDQKAGNPGIYNLPDDEFQRWVDTITPVYEAWIADMEAKGLPGRAILEDIQRLAEKYSK